MRGQINGLDMKESLDVVKEINSIKGVDCNIYIQESLIEFKSVFTQIVISIGAGVISSIIANVIYDSLKKNKDKGKKVSFIINNINIDQTDTSEMVKEKIDKIKENG